MEGGLVSTVLCSLLVLIQVLYLRWFVRFLYYFLVYCRFMVCYKSGWNGVSLAVDEHAERPLGESVRMFFHVISRHL